MMFVYIYYIVIDDMIVSPAKLARMNGVINNSIVSDNTGPNPIY